MGVENREYFPTKVVSKIGKETHLPNGWTVITKIPNPVIDPTVVTNEVDEHEGNHLLVAAELNVPIIEGSVIPDGNSRGHVRTGHFNAAVAMASFGNSGNGHDRMLVRINGGNESSAAAVASDIITRKPKHRRALAVLLHKEGIVSGPRVQSELDRVDQGETAETTLIDPEGNQRKIITFGIHGGDGVEVQIKNLLSEAA